jgi:hypothetical protein
MTSKHHKWQLRWRFDPATSQATHESGLVVSVGPGVSILAVNAPEVERALAVKNGPHNAPLMIRRLLKEVRELAAEGFRS